MSAEFVKKLEQIEKIIEEKLSEIKELKVLRKTYLNAIKQEKKIFGKGQAAGSAEQQNSGQ